MKIYTLLIFICLNSFNIFSQTSTCIDGVDIRTRARLLGYMYGEGSIDNPDNGGDIIKITAGNGNIYGRLEFCADEMAKAGLLTIVGKDNTNRFIKVKDVPWNVTGKAVSWNTDIWMTFPDGFPKDKYNPNNWAPEVYDSNFIAAIIEGEGSVWGQIDDQSGWGDYPVHVSDLKDLLAGAPYNCASVVLENNGKKVKVKSVEDFNFIRSFDFLNANRVPGGADGTEGPNPVYNPITLVTPIPTYSVECVAGTDEITSIDAPLSVGQGSKATVTVDYSAKESRDIIVSFQLSNNPNTTFYTETKTVPAGTGKATFDIVLPADVPLGVGLYEYQAILTTVGGGWAEKFNYLALSDVDVINNNLLLNFNFEQGVDVNWSPSAWGGGASTTATAASSNVYEGSVAYQLNVTTAVNIGNVSVQSDIYTVDMEGKTLDVSAWVKAEGSGQSFRFQITFYDINDNPTNMSSSTWSLPLNTYDQYYYSVSVPTGSVKLKVRLQCGAVGGTYYFDYVNASLSDNNTVNISDIAEKANNFSIYPNPAEKNDYINVISDNEISKVDIYDISGKLLDSKSHATSQVNISALSGGIYIIKVTESNGDVKQHKLIIKE